jgi:membrane-associated phospholipid phosphatase
MEYVSLMGTIYFLLVTVLVLIGGVNFRKGFLILNMLGWAALIIIGAKQYVDYPRPIAVDATLDSFGREKTEVDLSSLQPKGFFEGFSNDLLDRIRASDVARHGFPSGHVMIITSVWLGMALLFRRRWLMILSISLVLFTFISRLYLGVHYLGDVLGGLTLGLLFTFGFAKLTQILDLKKVLRLNVRSISFFVAPVILVLLYSMAPSFQVGALLGLNLGLLLILKIWGEPTLNGSIGHRLSNTFLLVILYFAMFFLARNLELEKVGLISIVVYTVLNFAVLIVAFYIGKLFGNYKSGK